MARPHVVVVPYPGSGNINPALQLAKLLRRHGVFITFVVTEHNLRRVRAATAEGSAAASVSGGREGFRIETIPDGLLDADRDAQDYDVGLSKATVRHGAAPLRALVARLRGGGSGVPPVTCVMPTSLMSFALDVARELGVPSMVLLGFGAAALMAQMRLRELKERGYLPLKDESCLTNGYLEKTIIDWIPGMPQISLGDVSSFVRTTDPDDFGLWFNITEANNCKNAGAVVINSFEALEHDVLAALRAEYPRIYTVGPLGTMLRRCDDVGDDDNNIDLSLWKHDTECLTWLDSQEPGSVVYANFGSLTVLTAGQLAEFAWGLAATRRPFLLVVRDDLVTGGNGCMTALPTEFLSETAERCRVATWCPQERVLRHRAVGCFVTHCGWNSACEGLAAGVPMVCWPVFADQFTICKYACEVWGVGIRLDEEVRREQVAGHVGEAMESEELRKSAARWKAEAEAAACPPGGSSYKNLLGLVKALEQA
ncbi:unnamed protein product [Urochloa decumbens]|uniref:Glycosyltransferase n=1 Tax=Urochloa decumbens TaxID=240449 RepID=A0ABC9BU89_9POAL